MAATDLVPPFTPGLMVSQLGRECLDGRLETWGRRLKVDSAADGRSDRAGQVDGMLRKNGHEAFPSPSPLMAVPGNLGVSSWEGGHCLRQSDADQCCVSAGELGRSTGLGARGRNQLGDGGRSPEPGNRARQSRLGGNRERKELTLTIWSEENSQDSRGRLTIKESEGRRESSS